MVMLTSLPVIYLVCLSVPEKTCTDPGAPLGGHQVAVSYEVGQTVSFDCDCHGCVLDDFDPLECVWNGTEPVWNKPVPECVRKYSCTDL